MLIRLRLMLLVVCLGLVAGLGLGGLRAAALSSLDDSSTSISQAQAFPLWKFNPVTSALPPGIVSYYLNDLGEQGELVLTYYPQGVEPANYGVVFGGTLTHMFSAGDQAPGGGTFRSNLTLQAYAASPSLVYFSAFVNEGGPDFLRHFRWSNGVLTHLPTQANESYDIAMHDSHGKFIFKRTVDAENTEYRISDGVTFSDPIILHNDHIDDDPNTSQHLIGITADGAFLIGESTSSGSPTCTLRPTAPDQPNEVTATSRLFWLGSRSGDVVAGSYTSNVCGGSGTNVGSGVMNSAGDILSQEHTQVIQPGGTGVTMLTTLRLYPGNGAASSVVAQGEQVGDVGPYFFLRPVAITEWRQPIFSAAATPSASNRLYDGPNPSTNQFDGDFFAGFGQDGTLNGIYHISEKGSVVGQAQLADNALVDVIGRAVTAAQWIDPAGGSWGDAGNWDSNEVPGSTSETRFGLEATYAVNVGTHDVGRVRIENGSVAFTNADLTLLGPLTVGGDATFTLPSGTLETSELIIGSLAPTDPLNPPTAHVFVSNQGTTITGTTVITIGHASPGDLFLSDARIIGGPLTIGENFPGSAVVSGQHSLWTTTGALAVGYGYTGTVIIEHGGELRSFGEVVIGYGATLQDYTATVDVSNQGSPALGLGNWLITDLFTLGNNLRGELSISNGGSVYITEGVLQAGLQAHGTSFDAFMDVNGSSDAAGITSTLGTFGDVLLGMADGADVGVNIARGGKMFIAGANLYLAHEAGSEATLTVAGINDHGARAYLEVTGETGSFETGICSVGENGQASLLVRQGGRVDCKTIRIGALPGSNGYVLVDGQNGGSTLSSESSLCIGSDPLGLCNGAASGQQGTLELRNSGNAVSARATVIGTGGRMTGSGTLIAGELGLAVFDGGVIEPGVTILGAQRLTAPSSQTIQPGSLNIGGNVSISPTAVITLDVIGDTPSLYDRLIVTGTANLGGQLVLNFGNGFAPQQGDNFQFMQAGAFASSFQTTTIAGLAPGFTYTLSSNGGAFNLVALNDGVPTTQAGSKVYLPLIRR